MYSNWKGGILINITAKYQLLILFIPRVYNYNCCRLYKIIHPLYYLFRGECILIITGL